MQKFNFQAVKVQLLERKTSTFGKRKFNRIFIRPFLHVYAKVVTESKNTYFHRFPFREFSVRDLQSARSLSNQFKMLEVLTRSPVTAPLKACLGEEFEAEVVVVYLIGE